MLCTLIGAPDERGARQVEPAALQSLQPLQPLRPTDLRKLRHLHAIAAIAFGAIECLIGQRHQLR